MSKQIAVPGHFRTIKFPMKVPKSIFSTCEVPLRLKIVYWELGGRNLVVNYGEIRVSISG